MSSRSAWLLTVLIAGAVSCLNGQSVYNPDISVIPRFLLSTDDGGQLPERRDFARPEFTLEELEIGLQADVNPYARGDIFLSMEGIEEPQISLEEAYVSIIKGLPLDMNIRLGKYRVEFGKLNMVHPHARPFVGGPLVQERFLGGKRWWQTLKLFDPPFKDFNGREWAALGVLTVGALVLGAAAISIGPVQ